MNRNTLQVIEQSIKFFKTINITLAHNENFSNILVIDNCVHKKSFFK